MSIPAHIEHTFKALVMIERACSPTSAATANKSLSHGQKDAPTAGIGTADAGLPITRYWTVKFERGGRSYFDHLIACDPFKANLLTFKRNVGATSAQVVREIQRDEFEHLTKVSP
jgi:hypothetical protein